MTHDNQVVNNTLRQLLLASQQHNASDIHIKPDSPGRLRVNGKLVAMQMRALSSGDTSAMVKSTMSDKQWDDFQVKKELDYSVADPDFGRYRVNAYISRGSIGMVLRRLPDDPPNLTAMGIPQPVSMLAKESNGLILVCGATGSGKSTTLAGLVKIINDSRNVHIVTIEDPIEYVHEDHQASIMQREVGHDTDSFSTALHSALRQDPDVILLGEMRDEETVRTALSASETGHLVMSTLHATSAHESISRFLDFFPEGERDRARAALAGSLRGIVCQRLVPTYDGKSRQAIVEILLNQGRTPDAILDPDRYDLEEIIATGVTWGMQTFDDHLIHLVTEGKVTVEIALEHCTNRQDMKVRLREAVHKRNL